MPQPTLMLLKDIFKWLPRASTGRMARRVSIQRTLCHRNVCFIIINCSGYFVCGETRAPDYCNYLLLWPGRRTRITTVTTMTTVTTVYNPHQMSMINIYIHIKLNECMFIISLDPYSCKLLWHYSTSLVLYLKHQNGMDD